MLTQAGQADPPSACAAAAAACSSPRWASRRRACATRTELELYPLSFINRNTIHHQSPCNLIERSAVACNLHCKAGQCGRAAMHSAQGGGSLRSRDQLASAWLCFEVTTLVCLYFHCDLSVPALMGRGRALFVAFTLLLAASKAEDASEQQHQDNLDDGLPPVDSRCLPPLHAAQLACPAATASAAAAAWEHTLTSLVHVFDPV